MVETRDRAWALAKLATIDWDKEAQALDDDFNAVRDGGLGSFETTQTYVALLLEQVQTLTVIVHALAVAVTGGTQVKRD